MSRSVLNIVWAANGLLLFTIAHPTPIGEAFVVLQVVTSLVLVELQFIGLRKGCAIVAA